MSYILTRDFKSVNKNFLIIIDKFHRNYQIRVDTIIFKYIDIDHTSLDVNRTLLY